MSAFAFYRLPYKDHYTLVMQHDDDPEKLNSVYELNGKHGFVIAPFMPSEECPILLMRPDVVKHFPIQAVTTDNKKIHFPESVSEKEAYQKDFEDFHQQLTKGIFDKIVLARCSHLKSPEAKGLKAEELFKKACQMYPRLFIALISTTQSGTWLMATPEILLSGNGCEFKTMALAGTHAGEETDWTKKEQEEQQYVTDYIEEVISEFTDEYSKEGPFTTMAANLYHLRTDFLFRLEDTDCLGDVLDALIRVDMSEYSESFNTSRLLGAPPGYVGYDEGGQLTERVRRKPYSIVLLDEIEKAHDKVYNMLLQVLDEGRLTDGNGRLIDFRNTVIIMTSNAGTRQLKEFGSGIGFNAGGLTKSVMDEKDKEYARSIIQKSLSKQFSPEFLNRLDEIITFNQLDIDAIKRIIDVELRGLFGRVHDMGYEIQITDKAKELVATKGYDVQFGARPLKRAIQTYIEDGVCELLLGGKLKKGDTISIGKNPNREELTFKVAVVE